MIAQEKMESRIRIPRITRATPLVCSSNVSGLANKSSAKPEIVLPPQEKVAATPAKSNLAHAYYTVKHRVKGKQKLSVSEMPYRKRLTSGKAAVRSYLFTESRPIRCTLSRREQWFLPFGQLLVESSQLRRVCGIERHQFDEIHRAAPPE